MRFKEDYGGITLNEIELKPNATTEIKIVHKGHQKISSFLTVSYYLFIHFRNGRNAKYSLYIYNIKIYHIILMKLYLE